MNSTRICSSTIEPPSIFAAAALLVTTLTVTGCDRSTGKAATTESSTEPVEQTTPQGSEEPLTSKAAPGTPDAEAKPSEPSTEPPDSKLSGEQYLNY